ncbi:MAG TPA: urate oxidase [Vicinamibacterales bacterium]|nr:urate oxidase [Vicinamibacterales bacterium]
MPEAALSETSYGKSRIRLVRVTRQHDPSTRSGSSPAPAANDRHQLRDFTVAVAFEGNYDTSYTLGDNADVLPTDTMKNTVYALAARDGVGEPESFGQALGRHFIDRNPKLDRVIIDILDHGWHRVAIGDRDHGSTFFRRGPEVRTAQVITDRRGAAITAGVTDLVIAKTSRSAFFGFPRDEFTTLPETTDRLFVTSLTATWTYAEQDVDFAVMFKSVRTTMLETFAQHDSLSVQHTLYAMGEAVLHTIDAVHSIRLEMPNRHHLPIDVSRFGLDNRNEVFVATEEPHGLIKATLSR